MRTRDLSQREFEAALQRHGFDSQPLVADIWRLPGTKCFVYASNGGKSRRARLAYMLRKLDEEKYRYGIE